MHAPHDTRPGPSHPSRTGLLSAAGLALMLVACGGGASSPTGMGTGGSGGTPDLSPYTSAPLSCAYQCPLTTCPEVTSPYVCPSLGDWQKIPHDPSCPAWDGSYPPVTPGQCTVSLPTGEAARYAGPDPTDKRTLVLPDGRRVRPAGSEWVFDESDARAGLTTGLVAVPGTSWVLTVDSGYGVHAVRAVDTAKLGAGDPVASIVEFMPPEALNSGIAFVPPGRVLVASDDGVVHALSFDAATGALARDDAHAIKLPPSKDANGNPTAWYVSGVAASPDHTRLVVSGVFDKSLLVYDLSAAGYGTQLGAAPLGAAETFGVAFDPHDPAGTYAYVSMWDGRAVVEVDVSNPKAPAVTRRFPVGQDPEGVAFLDGRWMAVANDLGDSLSLVDRVAGTVSTIPLDAGGVRAGLDPSMLAYDATRKRLYASLSGLDAVAAWDVDLGPSPPKVTPAGRLPTAWWPSGVVVLGDGSLLITNARGHGVGPSDHAYPIADGDVLSRLRGSVQRVPTPSASDLAAGDLAVQRLTDVGALPGHPAVTCPAGAHDFPVPETNKEGPSQVIKHVILIVRENKTFDGVLGDLAGVEGNAAYTLKARSADMDAIWKNLRTIARGFALSDNYYTSADLSIQGHVWTTYGRTNDFDERTWAMCGDGRGIRSFGDIAGIADVGRPDSGSLFDWLGRNHVDYDLFGEIVGTPTLAAGARDPTDYNYPGGFIQNIGYPDVEKACYVAGRMRVLCNLAPFAYQTLPNDHTLGAAPTTVTPESMCAGNDEATGMMLDALSHSPLWASSLFLVTEDDPSQGGEHVDNHRTLLVAASPWVKRGYVSKTHIDISSVHKLVAHVFGLPYPNVQVAGAGLPLDLFTSTPDYTPFVHTPRAWPLACGTAATRSEQRLTESWDLSDVDRNPGLDAQVMRWMRDAQRP